MGTIHDLCDRAEKGDEEAMLILGLFACPECNYDDAKKHDVCPRCGHKQ